MIDAAKRAETVELVHLRGAHGHECLVLNNRRIYGPKAWGGGNVVEAFDVSVDELLEALRPIIAAEYKTLEAEALAEMVHWAEQERISMIYRADGTWKVGNFDPPVTGPLLESLIQAWNKLAPQRSKSDEM